MLYKLFIKKILDFLIALILLSAFFPLLIVITLVLFLTNGRISPFFVQKRPGKNERIFSLIKFKTMSEARDENGELLPDAERLTKTGSFLRKTSFDEIPQLINVLKGDMSLIGPRPLLPEYLTLYSQEQRKRHNVKPGITGWAQVNGRNSISWEEKFILDVYYVENIGFKIDFEIFIKTIKKVVVREGISSNTAATMEVFKGSNSEK